MSQMISRQLARHGKGLGDLLQDRAIGAPLLIRSLAIQDVDALLRGREDGDEVETPQGVEREAELRAHHVLDLVVLDAEAVVDAVRRAAALDQVEGGACGIPELELVVIDEVLRRELGARVRPQLCPSDEGEVGILDVAEDEPAGVPRVRVPLEARRLLEEVRPGAAPRVHRNPDDLGLLGGDRDGVRRAGSHGGGGRHGGGEQLPPACQPGLLVHWGHVAGPLWGAEAAEHRQAHRAAQRTPEIQRPALRGDADLRHQGALHRPGSALRGARRGPGAICAPVGA
mmetsp:Transcript_46747/g.138100  ORF Transcript_46747/g.138100 Transcript_46747/m.138100 type:complete len:285 (-) Transcript_46747:8-862(-)